MQGQRDAGFHLAALVLTAAVTAQEGPQAAGSVAPPQSPQLVAESTAADGKWHRLVYRIRIDFGRKHDILTRKRTNDDILDETRRVFEQRVRLMGFDYARVVHLSRHRIYVEIPSSEMEKIAHLKKVLVEPGCLDLRVLAYDDYKGVEFDLAEERRRLDKFLATKENADLVAADARNIWRFNCRKPEEGGPKSRHLSWVPLFPRKQARQSGGHSEAHRGFLAINMHELAFTEKDLASGLTLTREVSGESALMYSIQKARVGEYADLSEKYLRKCQAVILNGYVRIAPVFATRIPGRGMISGGFTKAEAEVLARSLPGGGLPGVTQRYRPTPSRATAFVIEETTISAIHSAFRKGDLTARQLVEMYLDRITRLDKPNDLNAFVVMNEKARERADALDAEFKTTGRLRPLHGIPVVVKDNYDTHDLQTTGGSAALAGSLPPDDSFMVRKIRAAGSIVLGKTNMDEWAFSPLKTVSSILGTTRNPYDLERVPAGSSGGTAAAVSANLGAIGIGTDTGNSVRGPAAHCALVGIRPTIGLTSRDGIIPLNLSADVGGPMCRTVEDAARLLGVIAGYDPADPATHSIKGRAPVDYMSFLDREGLRGARVGVLRAYFEEGRTDPQVIGLMERAIADLERLGATILDPFEQPAQPRRRGGRRRAGFRAGVNLYLASLGDQAKVKTLADVVKSGRYHPDLKRRLTRMLRGPAPSLEGVQLSGPDGDPRREAFRDALIKAMDRHKLDIIIYPTWRFPPRKIGDRSKPHGDNSQILAPRTGMPALSVPMGFTGANLPAGLQMLGRPFDEGRLIKLAYAYEQGTKHRRTARGFSK